METVPAKGQDRVLIGATLGWTLLMICMTKDYEDLVSNSFHDDLWRWYQRGHFPCGWDGIVDPAGDYAKTMQSGKLMVY